MPRAGVEADQLQQSFRVVGVVVVRREEPKRLERADAGVEPAVLEHHPDAGSQRRAVAPGIEPEHAHLARVGPSVPLEDLDGGRLAGAVRPEQPEHLALADA